MKLTVIEHKHWIVDYVVELKERIPDLNEYGADQMSYYAGHVVGRFLPRYFSIISVIIGGNVLE